MNETMVNNEITIGASKLHGNGLFAARDFKNGEIVLGWNPNNRYLSEEEVRVLSDYQKRFIAIHNEKYLLIAEPERYMNHSCYPNTQSKNG